MSLGTQSLAGDKHSQGRCQGCHLEGWATLAAPADSDLGLPSQDFDRLLEALQAALAKDAGTGFVFSCLSGQGRTTTAMVVAVLAFWHIQVCVACCVRTGVCPSRLGPWSLGTLLGQEGVGGRDGACCAPGAPPISPGQWASRAGVGDRGTSVPALSSLRASPRWARRSS